MDSSLLTAGELLQQLGGNPPLRDHILLHFYECTIMVHSNSPALIERLNDYYEGYLGLDGEPVIDIKAIESAPVEIPFPMYDNRPDRGKKRIKEEYRDIADGRLVRKKQTGMVFVFGRETNTAIGPCLHHDNQVINFINNRYIQWMLDRGYILFHAAGVAGSIVGIALAGIAGSGKSTLALALMDQGMGFVSNDRLLVRRTGQGLEMAGIPKMPRINPGTAAGSKRLKTILTDEDRNLCDRLTMEELWEYERKYDVMVAEIFGEDRLVTSPVTMVSLVILNWERNKGKAHFREVDIRLRPELMAAFMKNPGVFYQSSSPVSQGGFPREMYLEHLGSCPVYELYGEVDFDQAATTCLRLLQMNGTARQS